MKTFQRNNQKFSSWVNYNNRRTESSSEHFASDLSLLKADELWYENKRCLDFVATLSGSWGIGCYSHTPYVISRFPVNVQFLHVSPLFLYIKTREKPLEFHCYFVRKLSVFGRYLSFSTSSYITSHIIHIIMSCSVQNRSNMMKFRSYGDCTNSWVEDNLETICLNGRHIE